VERALWEMNRPYEVSENPILNLDAEGNGVLGPAGEQVGNLMATIDGTITTNIGVVPNTRFLLSTEECRTSAI